MFSIFFLSNDIVLEKRVYPPGNKKNKTKIRPKFQLVDLPFTGLIRLWHLKSKKSLEKQKK